MNIQVCIYLCMYRKIYIYTHIHIQYVIYMYVYPCKTNETDLSIVKRLPYLSLTCQLSHPVTSSTQQLQTSHSFSLSPEGIALMRYLNPKLINHFALCAPYTYASVTYKGFLNVGDSQDTTSIWHLYVCGINLRQFFLWELLNCSEQPQVLRSN